MLKIGIKIAIGAVLFVIFLFAFSFLFVKQVGKEEIPKEKRSAGKGLYVTAYVADSPDFLNYILDGAKKTGLNTIVVDAKAKIEGPVLELIKKKQLAPDTRVAPNPWLSRLCKKLHAKGFIVSARLVVFKDDHLVIAREDLGIKLKGQGTLSLYRDLKWGRWADPYSDEVRLYNEKIAEIAALSGVDEVQFDYIRFPAERGSHNAVFPFEKEGVSRVDIINSFLKSVQARLKKYKVSIAVDIFGVTAWQSKNDIENLGQDLKKMAAYIDVLCPMFYPSHFHAGYDGFANPGSHPYYFMATGIRKTREILSGEAVAIVPWVQGFNLRSPNFGPNYILEQVRACKDEGADGYLIWNASNRYGAVFSGTKK
ncbi:MAG: hypothetical protein HQ596_04675 [Candidatus Saganbacteria bacterium]|nr:hypothetical protein [Candidatus Saganbacteria bacterium]